MIKNVKNTCVIAFLLLASLLISCAPGVRLNTHGAQDSEVTGRYRVIFYGCNFLNDLETIAFLDKEEDKYIFDPYAPEFNYRVKAGLDGPTSLAAAEHFLNCNASYVRTQLRRIIGPDNDIVGYELRPLYAPFTYGFDDVLETDYVIRGDKVVIYIRLVPSVERRLRDGFGHDREE
jgi:hypothetical protein